MRCLITLVGLLGLILVYLVLYLLDVRMSRSLEKGKEIDYFQWLASSLIFAGAYLYVSSLIQLYMGSQPQAGSGIIRPLVSILEGIRAIMGALIFLHGLVVRRKVRMSRIIFEYSSRKVKGE